MEKKYIIETKKYSLMLLLQSIQMLTFHHALPPQSDKLTNNITKKKKPLHLVVIDHLSNCLVYPVIYTLSEGVPFA